MVLNMVTITRVVSSIFAGFLLLTTFGLLVGGGSLLIISNSMQDSEGFINSPTYHVQDNQAVGIVSDTINIDHKNHHTSINYDNNIHISSSNSHIVTLRIYAPGHFIGIGSTSDVLTYLSGKTYLEVIEFDLSYMETKTVNAEMQTNLSDNLPVDQDFWITNGYDQIYFNPGAYNNEHDITIVILNSDGSQGVDIEFQAGAKVPFLGLIGWGLLVGSLFTGLFAIGCIILAVKSKDNKESKKYFVPYQYRVNMTENNISSLETNDSTVEVEELVQKKPNSSCINCGSNLDQDARFCSSCGYKTD